MSDSDAFKAARDLLLDRRDDDDRARASSRWPALDEFNWALDWFDAVAAATGLAGAADRRRRTAARRS